MEDASRVHVTIYGPGCPNCRALKHLVQQIAAAEGITIELVTDANFERYIDRGILRTPALEIEGALKSAGLPPPREKLRAWLRAAAAKVTSV